MQIVAADDDDEWEYEYDDETTEDIYMTFDLTTHVPPTLATDKTGKYLKAARSNKSLANARGIAQHSAPPSAADAASPQPVLPDVSRMQILDLHSTSPLISYNNSLYSCRWATDLGTSFFFAPPPASSDPHHPPLRSTPSFDLLGTSCARLIAVPASLQPRETHLEPVSTLQRYAEKNTFTTSNGDVIQSNPSQGLRIELPVTASAAKVSQARFLERLSAIKARRGDRDAVPVTNIKNYRIPDNWEAERNEWISKETAKNERHRLEAEMRTGKASGLRTAHSPAQQQPAADDADGESLTPDAGSRVGSDGDIGDLDPDHIDLSEEFSRKRRRRGFRGGPPSGKRLRQSLGLPDARRNKRPVGRPRKIRLDSEVVSAQGHDTEHSASPALRQDTVELAQEDATGGASQAGDDAAELAQDDATGGAHQFETDTAVAENET
ncbi:hypothetical protein MBLNU459_g7924t1 [Dothideomycetes sp. NU459]